MVGVFPLSTLTPTTTRVKCCFGKNAISPYNINSSFYRGDNLYNIDVAGNVGGALKYRALWRFGNGFESIFNKTAV